MERLKNMGLKRSFFLLSVLCLAAALFLTFEIWSVCTKIGDRYPRGGVVISPDGSVTELAEPSPEQERILHLLGRIQILAILVIPVSGLGLAGILFYRLKLKTPIRILKDSTERIRKQDLDFMIPEVSADELGEICAAFETMRKELLRTNKELWRQAEERKRLNAAFAHDLRNPITVLKGSVKLLRQDAGDEKALERLEIYVQRIEQYVEAMSSIQRLEQMPVCKKSVEVSLLQDELQETAGLLAPAHKVLVSIPDAADVELDHGLFLTVAENLIGNAARYAREKIEITLKKDDSCLILSINDDGPRYPAWLIQDGPKPFAQNNEDTAHFGMGLYSSQMLCMKHGGTLTLQNKSEGGAEATAVFPC